MRAKTINLLLEVYRNPNAIVDFNQTQWWKLISCCSATGMLARIYSMMEMNSLTKHIPERNRWHFQSAKKVVNAHIFDIQIEIDEINRALRFSGIVPVYLKGTAYILSDDICAQSRFFNDIDIYVPKECLKQVEETLSWHGWLQKDIDEYDEKYYRTWMHEIPPRHHKARGTNLDVHHNLLPLTSRAKLDTSLINEKIDYKHQTLSIEDKIIHSAAHLFFEEQFEKAIRDLTDIDLLIREQSNKSQSIEMNLVERAIQLGLGRTLFYTFRYLDRHLGTPISVRSNQKLINYAPPVPLLTLMDSLFKAAFTQPLSINGSFVNKFAHFCLYLRGHWLRMPPSLLIRHLLYKAFVYPLKARKKEKQKEQNINPWK